MQAFIHSYLPFFDFLGYVMHFYKFIVAYLMKSYLSSWKFFGQHLHIDKP
jgi:hypothetical protein